MIDEPDPVVAAGIAEIAGAQGITVHLREDRRHIQDRDVRILRETVKTRLNLEMAATDEMVGIALEIKPDMVTIVPEKRAELTTEGGLDVSKLCRPFASGDKEAKASGNTGKPLYRPYARGRKGEPPCRRRRG